MAPAPRPTTLSAILKRNRVADEAHELANRRRYGTAAARHFGRGGGAAPTPRALVLLHAATATEAGRVTERENLDVRESACLSRLRARERAHARPRSLTLTRSARPSTHTHALSTAAATAAAAAVSASSASASSSSASSSTTSSSAPSSSSSSSSPQAPAVASPAALASGWRYSYWRSPQIITSEPDLPLWLLGADGVGVGAAPAPAHALVFAVPEPAEASERSGYFAADEAPDSEKSVAPSLT
jgi:hypothetical protein